MSPNQDKATKDTKNKNALNKIDGFKHTVIVFLQILINYIIKSLYKTRNQKSLNFSMKPDCIIKLVVVLKRNYLFIKFIRALHRIKRVFYSRGFFCPIEKQQQAAAILLAKNICVRAKKKRNSESLRTTICRKSTIRLPEGI